MHTPPKSSVALCTLAPTVNTYWKVSLGPQINGLARFLLRFLRAGKFQNFPTKSIYLDNHLKGQPGAGL